MERERDNDNENKTQTQRTRKIAKVIDQRQEHSEMMMTEKRKENVDKRQKM